MENDVAALARRALRGDVLASAEIAAQIEIALTSDQEVLHQLMHRIADKDIRLDDPEHAALQRKELAKLLAY